MVRTLLVGIGGPTCSGKTTLVKHLISLLPSTPAGSRPFIIHQDDFAPPESSLIWNDEVGSADWDDPDTSVDWSRLQSFLIHVKASGKLPKGHTSHDELNALPELPIAEEISAQCRQMLREVLQHDGLEEDVQIVLLDGFLLYYDRKVRSMIDVSVFLRIGRDMLADRRRKRGGYVTAEGVTWNDSPLYFDRILWPSHVKAHAHLFVAGDVEAGQLSPPITEAQPIRIIEAQEPAGTGAARPMDDVVLDACRLLTQAFEHSLSSTK